MKSANKTGLFPFLTMGLILFFSNGCKDDEVVFQIEGYPINPVALTTSDRTVVVDSVALPAIYAYEVSEYQQYGYGVWHYGAGLPFEKRLDLMPSGYPAATVTNTAKLLHFFAMTDIHITDKESPAGGVYFGWKIASPYISAYSPVMLYTTHVLDAAVQTVNALHKENKFDFGIALGDICNNTQYNELRWFIDVFDGKNINPDSGDKDDPKPGPNNDYQDEYKAAGLDQSIPWYATMGNHDHFWMGVDPVDDYIRQTLTGDSILKMGNIFTSGGILRRDFYMGVLDGRTLYGDVLGAGPVVSTFPEKIAADPKRRSLTREQWMNEFSNTSTSPNGHGFSQADAATGFACYSFEPKSDLPLKVIVLDDTQRDDDTGALIYGYGSLDQKRYDWLVAELDKGQTEGKLMVIAAHIPIGVEKPGSFLGWWSKAYVTENNLMAKLHTYPNLILWVSGHRHLNTVTPLPSPDAARPELGFWEIETSSLREYPQQFRTFDIVRNSDNTISIFTTDVDPAVKDGSFAAVSRSYAIAANQIFRHPLLNRSYNAELVKKLSAEMQTKIQNHGTTIVR